tara:strand:+ start:155 stop:547 length:393 start_codon:yes stop_codon:yes gene_type:complete
MPKPKPDQVIRHEIVLSRPLQDTVDGLVGSKQFNNIATPIITAVNDNTTLILLLATIATLGLTGVAFAYLPPKLDEAIDIYNDFKNQRKMAMQTAKAIGNTVETGAYATIPGVSFAGGQAINDFLDSLFQ